MPNISKGTKIPNELLPETLPQTQEKMESQIQFKTSQW